MADISWFTISGGGILRNLIPTREKRLILTRAAIADIHSGTGIAQKKSQKKTKIIKITNIINTSIFYRLSLSVTFILVPSISFTTISESSSIYSPSVTTA